MNVPSLPEVRKAAVYAVSFVLGLINMGLVPAEYQHYVYVAIGILTLVGIYQAPNAPKTPKV